jgi:hypothetical protein
VCVRARLRWVGTKTLGVSMSNPRLAFLVGLSLLLAVGCGSDPEGDGNGGGPQKQQYAEIEVSPSELNFSPLAPGDTQTLTVSIKNIGSGKELTIKQVFIRDQGTPFAVSPPEVETLATDDSTQIAVTYVATATAPEDTVLIINTNAATQPTVEVPIRVGQALEGLLVLPNPINFGEVLSGESKIISVSIRNTGSAAMELMNVFIELGGSEDFLIIDPPTYPVQIGAGSDTFVDISYTPLLRDVDEAWLVIAYKDGGSQALEKIRIQGIEVGPELSVSPPKIDFGWVPINTKAEQELSVHNMGQHDLKITGVYTAPGTNVDVAIDNPPGGQIEVKPGEATTFTISFKPQEFFVTTPDPIGGIVLETNDGDEAIVNVPVYGNIDAPFILLDPPDKVDFGIVAQGWTIERTLIIQNVGHAPLTVDSIEVVNNTADLEFGIVADEAFPPTDGSGEGLVTAEEQIEVKLTFTNDGAPTGNELGKLRIHSDDPMTPDAYVELSATRGGSPECKLGFVPGKLNFGTVAHGSTDTKQIFIKNLGSGYCSWKSGMIRECVSFMGMMTNCSETAGASSEFIPQGMPIPVMDGMAPGTAHPVQILYKPPTTVPFIPLFEEYYGALQVKYTEPYSTGGTYTEHTFPEADAMGNLQWNIHGTSGVADIAVLPDQVDFGLVTIGCYSKAFKVKVYNAGTAPLDITDIYLDSCGPEFQVVDFPALPLKVQPSQFEELCIVYLPQNEGPDECKLLIESSDLDTPVFPVPLRGEGTWDTEHTDYFTQISGKKVDLLFVIDESASMCGEQDNLALNFNVLTQAATQWGNDFQVAITTTNVTDEEYVGKFSGSPRILDKTTIGSFGGNIEDIGCNGSGQQESGLEGGRRAISAPLANDTNIACSCGEDQPCPGVCDEGDLCVKGFCGGYNRGFLRSDAALEVVMVSDEEDQSPGSVPFYIDFFKSIKGFLNEDMMHVHAIVGDKNGGCTISADEGADAGKRYIEVQENTGGEFGSICDKSFANVLKDIGNKAFGLQKQFFLSAQADGSPGNIKVWVDTGAGFQECTTGWDYQSDTNSVVFNPAGNCMPQPGDEIKIWYKMVCNNADTVDCN